MKNSRFFYLYLIGGFVAVCIIIYDLLTSPAVRTYPLTLEIILAVFFFYMANKTYREKKDKELM